MSCWTRCPETRHLFWRPLDVALLECSSKNALSNCSNKSRIAGSGGSLRTEGQRYNTNVEGPLLRERVYRRVGIKLQPGVTRRRRRCEKAEHPSGRTLAYSGTEPDVPQDENSGGVKNNQANGKSLVKPPYVDPNAAAMRWKEAELPKDQGLAILKEKKREAALGASPCIYIRRTLRGERESHPGTVVVYGDVLEEATVLAGGDILVFGRLSGRVHAGKSGDRDAVVVALDMQPRRVEIADRVAGQPEEVGNSYPEIACIGPGGTIVIRPAGRLLSKVTSVEEIEDLRTKRARGGVRTALSAPSRAALFTGAYIFAAGVAALVFPRTIFGLLFDPSTIATGWIRVFAVLAMVFGVMYMGTAAGDALAGMPFRGVRAFYFATVIARYMLFFLFGLLVAFGAVQPTLIVLGVVNFLGALWMQMSLQTGDKV